MQRKAIFCRNNVSKKDGSIFSGWLERRRRRISCHPFKTSREREEKSKGKWEKKNFFTGNTEEEEDKRNCFRTDERAKSQLFFLLLLLVWALSQERHPGASPRDNNKWEKGKRRVFSFEAGNSCMSVPTKFDANKAENTKYRPFYIWGKHRCTQKLNYFQNNLFTYDGNSTKTICMFHWKLSKPRHTGRLGVARRKERERERNHQSFTGNCLLLLLCGFLIIPVFIPPPSLGEE